MRRWLLILSVAACGRPPGEILMEWEAEAEAQAQAQAEAEAEGKGKAEAEAQAEGKGKAEAEAQAEAEAEAQAQAEGELSRLELPLEQVILPEYESLTPVWEFRDVTEEVGIDFIVEKSQYELHVGGVGMIDVEGDGDLDLILTSDASESAFYRNDGNGAFFDDTEAVGLAGIINARGVSVADYDGDGDSDLYLCRDGNSMLLRNDDGVFSDVAAELGAQNGFLCYSSTWCDYDVDGDLDLIVPNYLITLVGRDYPYFRGNPNRVYRNDGDAFVDVAPELGVDSTGASFEVLCTDYDNDGDSDLYEVNDYGMWNIPNRLWRNDGGSFVDVAPALGVDAPIFGMGAAVADYDNDGDLDLYATNAAANVLHRNDGDSFTEIAGAVGVRSMSFEDPEQTFIGYPPPPYGEDGCGDFQLALGCFIAGYTNPASEDHLLTSWAPIFFDYDQDGWQDLYVANGYVAIAPTLPEGRSQPNLLYRNLGGFFIDRTVASRAGVRGDDRAAAAGDLDGDGDLDLVVLGAGVFGPETRSAHVLLNEGLKGHYLAVRPVGTVSNRESIGARVTVQVGELTQLREISGGSGWASASARDAHFGIGEAELVDVLEVVWPSGLEVTLTDVGADQLIEVVEPSE